MEKGDILDFSIVVPVYYNEESLEGLYHELDREVFKDISHCTVKVIFVDDGSGDDSYNILCKIQEVCPGKVRVIKLSRNFGQVNAIWAGLMYSRGRATAVISADRQDPASLIAKMYETYNQLGKEIVICTRRGRDETAWRKVTSGIFYFIMRKLCFSNMPAGGFDCFTLGPCARKVLLRNYQQHGFLQGQILRLGFQPHFLEYQRRARDHGQSRWSFGRKLTYLMDGVIGYSFFPLRMMSCVGSLSALAGFLYALVVFVYKIIYDNPVQGWTPLMIVILLIGGVQMLMLGIIGEYLWRVKAQVTKEEPYIVERLLEAD